MKRDRVLGRGGFLCLRVFLLLSLWIPSASAATYSGGSGTEASPYLISTSTDLLTLCNTANSADWASQFLMTADIDMTGITTFTPIGNNTTKFTGVFDGGGYSIQNLTIDLPTTSYVGFFGYVDGAPSAIKNLGMENVSISGSQSTGGLVGYFGYGSITSCYTSGTVTGATGRTGGLAGYVGCGSTIMACYSTGAVSGTSSVGGLAGDVRCGSPITACYSTGAVSGTSSVGGLVGSNSDSTVLASFWNTETSGQSTSPGGVGLTTTLMQTCATFQNAGWGAYNWVMTEGEYPRLAWEGTGGVPFTALFVGSGTEADPCLISTPEDLLALSGAPTYWSKYFLMTADIDMTGITTFTPIGNNTTKFNGVFDGGNFTIKNLTLSLSTTDYVGLFGYVSGSTASIKNLGIENSSISGKQYTGALAGFFSSGSITSCHTTGSVTGFSDNTGGLVGYTNNGTITSSYSTTTVTGTSYVGGLIGQNWATVTNCYATTGKITGSTGYVGGLVGRSSGSITASITASYAGGEVECTGSAGYSGGLVGYVDNSLSASYATGSVTGTSYVGGLMGMVSANGITTACYSIGSVSGTSSIGGLVGANAGTIKLSFWNTETSGQSTSPGGTGATTSEMKTRATFQNAAWGFYDWVMIEGEYPRLAWEGTGAGPFSVLFSGSGTQTTPYLISTPDDLLLLAITPINWSKYFLLTNNIDMTGITTFTPIGNDTTAFTGVFDGGGYAIQNLTINPPQDYYVGLFGYVLGASSQIKNLGIQSGAISGSSYMGGLVGGLRYGSITLCYVTGTVSGGDYVGGLVGRAGGMITSSYTETQVTGSDYVGGLSGYVEGTVTDCHATGKVTATSSYAGGLVGFSSESVVSSYASGEVKCIGSTGYVGGLVGSTSSLLTNCHASGTVTGTTLVGGLIGSTSNEITSCYATGAVTGSASYVGGLVGSSSGSISSSYAVGEVKCTGSTGYAGGLAGSTGGTLTSCHATGIVTGTTLVGGLVGSSSDTITSCCATGSVTASTSYVGGLVGKSASEITTSYAAGTVMCTGSTGFSGGLVGDTDNMITASYATGGVTGTAYTGGLVGSVSSGSTIMACYSTGVVSGTSSVGGLIGTNGASVPASFWDSETSGQTTSAGGTGLSTDQMKIRTTFQNVGWAAYDWVMTEGEYPRLAWEGTGGLPFTPLFLGSGAETDPYLISTSVDLLTLAAAQGYWSKYLLMTTDIDMTGVTSFTPIGSKIANFTGVFDGGGYVVQNLTINLPAQDHVGLFGYVSGTSSQIKNLGIEGGSISGKDSTGGLVGSFSVGKITSCHTTDAVTGSSATGGLVGGFGGRGEITSCYATGAVKSSGYAGGLVGSTSSGISHIKSCFATGMVMSSGSNVGGLLGNSQWGLGAVVITSCYATGAVAGWVNVGGLVGYSCGGTNSSYATGAVTAKKNLGGLVGYSLWSTSTFPGCFWDTTTGGPDNGYGTGLPTEQMKQQATFTAAGWDFTTPVWALFENISYPQLYGLPVPIDSIVSLQMVSYIPGDQFFLTKDLDALDTSTWSSKSTGFAPLCSSSSPFVGMLDGCGHRIYGLHISRPTMDQVGLFSSIGAAGVVKRLGLDDADITGRNEVGGLAGVNRGTVNQCYVQGVVSGTQCLGGLVGNNQGSVKESYAAAALAGNSVGGLLGVNSGTATVSFWDTMASSTFTSGGGSGLPTASMKALSTFNGAGWDMTDTWSIVEGASYPYFRNSAQLRVVTKPPCLINADAVDIVVEAFTPDIFVTIGGGNYPVYYTCVTKGQAAISIPLKQEAINRLIISTISTTGEEVVVAEYSVYESDMFPSTPTSIAELSITPLSLSLVTDEQLQFLCYATFADGTSAEAMPVAIWNVNGRGGSITITGLYTHSVDDTVTVQSLLHTQDGWRYSNLVTVTTTTPKSDEKADLGNIQGVVRSHYTGLGLPLGRVTAYPVHTQGVEAQHSIHDVLGNYSFFLNEGIYHFEGSCPGYRSILEWGGHLLEGRELLDLGPPPEWREPYYSGQVDRDRRLEYNFALRPNDTQAPWVVFIEPVTDTTVNTHNIVVTAIDADKYSELAVAQYTHNAVEYDIPDKISSTGFYRDTWPLALGLNVLHLNTVDTEGNASEKTIQITYDPNYTGPGGDTDGDGMPDAWEKAHGLNFNSAEGVNGADGDLDGDGLTNMEEYQRGTLPNSKCSDSDDLEDNFEVLLGTDPLLSDTDGDGLDDDVEYFQGSDPLHDDRIKMKVINLTENATVHGDAITLLAEVLDGYIRGAVASVSLEVRGSATGNAWRVLEADLNAPFLATWDTTAYPAGTYQVRAVATSYLGCVDGTPETVSVAVSPTGVYYERIEGGVHILSAPVSAVQDTVLALRAGNRFARITIPAGALTANDTLTAFFPDASAFTPALNSWQADAQLYLSVSLTSGTTTFLADKRAEIMMSYPDTDGDDHLDETDLSARFLQMVYLPTPASAFTPIASSAWTRSFFCITGETTHFSTFNIIEEYPKPPLNILTASLPQGVVGAPYNAALDANGGEPPYTWTVASASLPNGLNLIGNTLTGIPTTPGTFTFTLQAADAQVPPMTSTQTYTVNIYDATCPTVTVTRASGQTGWAKTPPIAWIIQFSEPVSGFETSDIVLSGTASYGAMYEISGTEATYTLTVTALTYDGTLHPSVPAGAAASIASSSPNQPSMNEEEVWVDSKTPQVQITCTNGSVEGSSPLVISALPIVFQLEFSEDVTGLTSEDIQFAETIPGLSYLVEGSNKTYTLIINGASSASTITPRIIPAAVQDGAGNANVEAVYAGRTIQYTPDTRPSVTVQQFTGQPDPTNALPIQFRVTFSQPVTGFEESDLVFVGTALNPQYTVSGTDADYTIQVNGAASDGRIGFYVPENVVDGGNRASTSTDNRVDYDATRPNVLISSTASEPTYTTPIPVTVTFNELVTGFTTDDIAVTNATVTGFTGKGMRYLFNLNPIDNGTITASIAENAAVDDVGNLSMAAASFTRTYSGFLHVTMTSSSPEITNVSPIPVTVTFSDAVTGFEAGDISVTNATITGFTGTGASYSFNLLPSDQGIVTAHIPADVAQNIYGVKNVQSEELQRAYDSVPPQPILSSPTPSQINISQIQVATTFMENVTGFTYSDLLITNGSVSNFSGAGANYSFSLTFAAEGLATIQVPAGACTDAAGNANSATAMFSRTYDITPPTVTMSSTVPNDTNVSPIPVTVVFSESVTGFAAEDIIPTNSAVTGFTGSSANYSFSLVPSGQGVVTVQINAGVCTDLAGNPNAAATPLGRTYDSIPPTPSLGTTAPNPTRTSPIPVTVNFGEPVSGFISSDVSVTNGAVSNFNGSGGAYTFDVIPSGQGTVTVSIDAGVCADTAGNLNLAASPINRTYDSQPPQPVSTSPTSSSTNVSPIPVTVTFGESVNGFTEEDVTLTNGTLNGFTGSGASYSFDVVPGGQGMVKVEIVEGACTDIAGNPNATAAPLTRTYDTIAPTVSMTSTSSNPTNLSPIPVTVTFSESVGDFTGDDLLLTNASMTDFMGSGTSYNFKLVPSGQGAVSAQAPAGAAHDAAGNSIPSSSYTNSYDSQPPTVSLDTTATEPTNTSPIPVTVSFSESVNDFALGDISTNNGSAVNLQGSGAAYTFDLVPAGQGIVSAHIASDVVHDAAGNDNTASATLSRTYSSDRPTVSLFSLASDPTNQSPFSVSVTFSKPVDDFEQSDINVLNASIGSFGGSGIQYSVDVTPAGQGLVTVSVAENVAHDSASNGNQPAQFSISYDSLVPVPVLSTPSPEPTNVSPIPIVCTFGEPVLGFTADDVLVTNGTINDFTGDGTEYSFAVIPLSLGETKVEIPENICADLATNPNAAAVSLSRTYDSERPTVSMVSGVSDPTSLGTIEVTVVFSKSVEDFMADDVTLSNAALDAFSGSGTTYQFTLHPLGEGLIRAEIAEGRAHDSAGNPNQPGIFHHTYDIGAPQAMFSTEKPGPGYQQVIPVWVTFTEPVKGLDVSDFLVENGSVILVSGAGAEYYLEIQAEQEGVVTLILSAGSVQDMADNLNAESVPLGLGFYRHLAITADPVGGEAMVGEPYSFRVGTEGGIPPLNYIWFHNDTEVCYTPEYVIEQVEPEHAGVYAVEISDAGNDAVRSHPAELIIIQALLGVGLVGLVFLAVFFAASGFLWNRICKKSGVNA